MNEIESPSPIVAPIVTGEFDEDVSYHTLRKYGTRDWLIMCTLDGGGLLRSAGKEFVARRNDVFLLAPGAPHHYGTFAGAKHWHFLWAHFVAHAEWQRWLALPEVGDRLYHVRFDSDVEFVTMTESLARMHYFATCGHKHGKILAMNALEAALILSRSQSTGTESTIDDRITKCTEAIRLNLGEDWSIPRLASNTCLSPSRFMHLFRQQMNVTPQRFVEDRRIERARQLLALSDLKIQEVSHEVGFENPLYFSNRFKARVGISPSGYRQAAANAQAGID